MANASSNTPSAVGSTGLSWSQIIKRYDDFMDEVFHRCKYGHPFALLAKHRDTEDGVYIYFTQFLIQVPVWNTKKNKWEKFKVERFDLGGGGIGSVANFKKYVAERTGISSATLNEKGIAGEGAPEYAKAPVKIQFSTSKSRNPSISQTINSGWIHKDHLIYGTSNQGLGGRLPPGVVRQVNWGKLAYLNSIGINYTLNNPTASESGESSFISDFNSQLEEIAGANGGRGLNMKIGNKTYENVIGVNKVAGTGKADLVFVALQNGALVEVCWASHKKGFKAKDFGQWGGMTDLYPNDPTVKEFVDYMKEIVGIGKIIDFTKFDSGVTVGMKISGPKYANLRKYAVYGPKHSGSFGPEKCNVVLQGDPIITYGRTSTLSMSGHLQNFPTEMTGAYEPVLMCIKKSSTERILAGNPDRSNFDIAGARFSIYPYGENTRVTHWVVKDRDGNLKLDTPVV